MSSGPTKDEILDVLPKELTDNIVTQKDREKYSHILQSNAQAANAEFKSNYDDGSAFMGKVLSHPVSFILMLGAWRAGLKGLSAMSKGGKDRSNVPL